MPHLLFFWEKLGLIKIKSEENKEEDLEQKKQELRYFMTRIIMHLMKE
jgi:hypothetical protein